MRRLMKPALTSQLLVALLAVATVSTAADSPIKVRLWPWQKAPVGDGKLHEMVESELKVICLQMKLRSPTTRLLRSLLTHKTTRTCRRTTAAGSLPPCRQIAFRWNTSNSLPAGMASTDVKVHCGRNGRRARWSGSRPVDSFPQRFHEDRPAVPLANRRRRAGRLRGWPSSTTANPTPGSASPASRRP